jgi:hypothetical protein
MNELSLHGSHSISKSNSEEVFSFLAKRQTTDMAAHVEELRKSIFIGFQSIIVFNIVLRVI